MRKYLEQEMLAECMKGRIRYNCASYPDMDGKCIIEIFIDGKLTKQFSCETVNTYFGKNGYKSISNPYGSIEYRVGFFALLHRVPLESRTEYTDEEFCDALKNYRNSSAESSFFSENPIERMFAVFDRRIGKRRLLSTKSDLNDQPQWLQDFYRLRFEAEEI